MNSNTKKRKVDQKAKAYLVYDYLMRTSDESHEVSASEIVAHLQELGIDAERRSIYRYIEDINKAILIAQGAAETIDEAEELYQDEEERTIIYDKHLKGFYVRQRRYDSSDIRLLAESVYTARFIEKKTSQRLIDIVCDHVSEHEASQIKHDVFLTDRIKTDNTSLFANINTINIAMSRYIDGEKHIPEKIKFKYLYRTIQDFKVRVERGKGAEYVVSPYKLLINDGNYYLLAYDDKKQKMRTFRVDRMKSVKYTGIARDGEEEFNKINLEDYTLSHFGMFEGAREHVTLRFTNNLLDTVIDRFGTNGVIYSKVDDRHFSVHTTIAISKQFYGWLCGFGNQVKILSPDYLIEDYKKHLEKSISLYDCQ